jgi:hypothetical protein
VALSDVPPPPDLLASGEEAAGDGVEAGVASPAVSAARAAHAVPVGHAAAAIAAADSQRRRSAEGSGMRSPRSALSRGQGVVGEEGGRGMGADCRPRLAARG